MISSFFDYCLHYNVHNERHDVISDGKAFKLHDQSLIRAVIKGHRLQHLLGMGTLNRTLMLRVILPVIG